MIFMPNFDLEIAFVEIFRSYIHRELIFVKNYNAFTEVADLCYLI